MKRLFSIVCAAWMVVSVANMEAESLFVAANQEYAIEMEQQDLDGANWIECDTDMDCELKHGHGMYDED